VAVREPTRAEQQALDRELMRRVVARDEAALGQLYDRYSSLVYSVAARIVRDTGAAEEILQDIFHQLWQKASQFDPARGSLPGWLLVAARNRAISRSRRRKPGDGEELEENTVAFPNQLESAVAQKQMLGRVRGVMDSLPAPQREALELAYFEGLTHSEIVQRTGEPLGTVKTRLRTALETLKRTLHL
jgi:RNA polymerase sigma-70 factor (ECF subfamily)